MKSFHIHFKYKIYILFFIITFFVDFHLSTQLKVMSFFILFYTSETLISNFIVKFWIIPKDFIILFFIKCFYIIINVINK